MKTNIAASIYAGNLLNIEESLNYLNELNVMSIHYDVMDGNFVDSVSIGELLLNELVTKEYRLDLHLMHQRPLIFLKNIESIISKISFITIHFESDGFLDAYNYLKEKNIKFGIAINPDTSIDKIEKYLCDIDVVLVMSVVPGKSGQKFIDITDKLDQLNNLEFNGIIQVDGGINNETLEKCLNHGANDFVIGSYLFKKDNKFKVKEYTS